MTDDELQQAIDAIKAGKRDKGQVLLTNVLKRDPQNEVAWQWLSVCQNTNENKIYCLQQALEINPANTRTKDALDKLLAQNQKNFGEPSVDMITAENPKKAKHKTNILIVSSLGSIVIIAIFAIGVLYFSAILSGQSTPRETVRTFFSLTNQGHIIENDTFLFTDDAVGSAISFGGLYLSAERGDLKDFDQLPYIVQNSPYGGGIKEVIVPRGPYFAYQFVLERKLMKWYIKCFISGDNSIDACYGR